MTNTECTEGYRTEYYNGLFQGTYYIPIQPGWNDGPFVDPSTGEYGLSITASASGDVCSCCFGRAGDANGSGDDEPTIGDISVMIDALFIGSNMAVIPCLPEADVNQSGGFAPTAGDITIGDISYLIDYLFITGPTLGLPACL